MVCNQHRLLPAQAAVRIAASNLACSTATENMLISCSLIPLGEIVTRLSYHSADAGKRHTPNVGMGIKLHLRVQLEVNSDYIKMT